MSTPGEHYWVYDFRDSVWASDLGANERLVLLAMSLDCDYRTGKNCRPGMKRLRSLTGLSERTITRVRQTLAASGWLELEAMGSRKGREQASVYRLTVPTRVALAGVKLSTPATQSGVTCAPLAGVETGTPATQSETPAKSAPDPCQVGDPPLLTTTDHAPGLIPSHHQAVAADGLKVCRSIKRREAS